MPRHPMLAIFASDDIIRNAVVKLNAKGRDHIHSARGATVALAMIAYAELLEGLAAEIRAASKEP